MYPSFQIIHIKILLPEVTTSKDVPGFVSNALLMPFINEVRERRLSFSGSLTSVQAIMCLEKVLHSVSHSQYAKTKHIHRVLPPAKTSTSR